MTYKYSEVRREIYNCSASNPLKKFRSFKDMVNLFTWYFWSMILLMFVAMIAYILLILYLPNKLFWLIPVPLFFIIPYIFEICCERLYHPSARKKELEEYQALYLNYIHDLQQILVSCGIDTPQKEAALKAECITRLDNQKKPYISASDATYSFLIGMPIGALVSSVMDNSDATNIVSIIGLVALGLLIIGFIRMIKFIRFYCDGYFKDQRLLSVLNELEYHRDS